MPVCTKEKKPNTAKGDISPNLECLVGVWINVCRRVGDSGRHKTSPVLASGYNTGQLLVFLILGISLCKLVLDSLAEFFINRGEMVYS